METANSTISSISATLNQHQEYIRAIQQLIRESEKPAELFSAATIPDARIQSLEEHLSAIEASILEEAFTILIEHSDLQDQLSYREDFLRTARDISREIFDPDTLAQL
ncbi:MAG: hypothetical protein U5J63_09520 [Fodinibius sp.]|nr:hypothetical protein [Fodinibius sp.]